MTLRGHLLELRNRLFLVLGVLLVVSTIAYVFRDGLLDVLLLPLEGRELHYLTPGGGFKFIFSVAFFAGLAAAIPLAIHQIYMFLSPILSSHVRRRGWWLLFWSLLLLVAGIVFGYVFAVPGALRFLYGFADGVVLATLTADSYLDFVVKYTLGLGLVFQIPLVMMVIHWIKPQRPMRLMKFQRWVILLAFIAGAIITPTPDPVNQAIVAVPIILVYQAGVIAVSLSVLRQRRQAKKTAVREPVAEVVSQTSLDEVVTEMQRTAVSREEEVEVVAPVPLQPVAPPAPLVSPAAPVRRVRSVDGFGVRPRPGVPVRSQAPSRPRRTMADVITPTDTAVARPVGMEGVRRPVVG